MYIVEISPNIEESVIEVLHGASEELERRLYLCSLLYAKGSTGQESLGYSCFELQYYLVEK